MANCDLLFFLLRFKGNFKKNQAGPSLMLLQIFGKKKQRQTIYLVG